MASSETDAQTQQALVEKQKHHQVSEFRRMSCGKMRQTITSTTTNPASFISKDGVAAYDHLGELDPAIFLYLDEQDHPSSSAVQKQKQNSGMTTPTLNIFPSKPTHGDPSSTKSSTKDFVSPAASGSKRSFGPSMELSNQMNDTVVPAADAESPPAKATKSEGKEQKGATSSSEHDKQAKTPDAKTLRRLARNREAARKSRLRKKAYVQQLETSRLRLTQLEQDIQRGTVQGYYCGGAAHVTAGQGLPLGTGKLSSDAILFDMEYGRWLEEHERRISDLRTAVQEHLPDNELRFIVDNCLSHSNEIMNLKSMVARTDVFHLVSGTWRTPAERCYMWIGGSRPSDLLKIEPLTEQQLVGICGIQQSTKVAEDKLSKGLDALNQSVSEIIVSDSLGYHATKTNYMGQMALATGKLSSMEGFVRQADNLRRQTIHRLHQILTIRQVARCLLAIAEYFHRLRALSYLWMRMAHPRQD